jgi:thiamine biosynthesis lipoprotein
MASELHVVVVSADAASATAGFDDVLVLLRHLEQSWSRFLPDSDVSRLNGAAGRPVTVDPSTLTLVAAMVDGWKLTDGRFDPSVLPVLLEAGYRASIDDRRLVTILPSGRVVVGGYDEPHQATLGDIVVDADALTITLPFGLAIDPGGIGKGLAADLAVGQLLSSGAAGALVSIGGDMVMGGAPVAGADDMWTVAVEHPITPAETVCTLAINSGGVATSSTHSRRWIHHGELRHHAIDPQRAAQSTTDLASVTVVAPTGWLAEVHATAALIAGGHGALRYLEQHQLSGVVVHDDGRTSATADLDLGPHSDESHTDQLERSMR